MAGSFTPPAGELASRSAPFVYTAERELIAISIGFGPGRPEERVYRDGVFLPGYQGSSRDGNVYTIVRDSIWPAPPTPYVDPLPPVPSGGNTWGGIYSVDFAAQPTQPLNALEAHTIAGVTWYPKNGISASSIGIVAGQGLSWVNGGSASFPAGRVLALPLANVPGFNPSAPVQVWVTMQRVSGSEGIFCGLIDAPASTANYNTANPPDGFWMSMEGTASAYVSSRPAGNNGFNGPAHGATWETTMIGVYAVNAWADAGIIESGYAGGDLPPLAPWEYGSLYWATGRAAKRTSPCFALSAGWNANCVIKKLTVMQPRVPA